MQPKGRAVLFALLLAVATLAVYYPVRNLPFTNYDDDIYVTDNVHVQSGLEWDTVQWAFTTYSASNWHPLTWLSHALDFQLVGLDPAGPHVVNLLLHTLNVVLLFWVLWRATGYAGRSAMVAGLFAVHPINVQSVAWVAERKNLLSMMFFLLALGAYRWYAQTAPRIGRKAGGLGCYLIVTVLFALGLMTKPQIITLPMVLLLWDYWPLGRMSAHRDAAGIRAGNEQPSVCGESASVTYTGTMATRPLSWLVWEKIPLFTLSAVSAVITLHAHSTGHAVRWLPFSMRVANAFLSYARYVKLAFWPSGLALFYPHPVVHLTSWEVMVSAVFLLGVTAWIVEGRFSLVAVRPSSASTTAAERTANSGYLLAGWFWFVITLLPMIGIVQVGNQGMADRYAYLSFVGLFIMLTWSIAEWANHRHVPTKWQAAVGIAVLLTLSVTTRHQLDYWRDSVTLWTHTIEVTRGNHMAEVDLGAALLQAGNFEEAMKHFHTAVAIDPEDPLGNMFLARYAQMQDRLPEAIEGYKKVIATSPDPRVRARAYNYMGHAYRALGNEAEAQKCFQAAASLGY